MTNEELAERIQQGETGLISQLWEQIRALVCWYAIRFYNRQQERCTASGVTVEDLTQEGFLAVLDAVQAYDPAKEYKFTSYLKYPLKNRFKSATGGRENNRPDPLNRCTSLDAPIGEDNATTIADTAPDENAGTAFETVEDDIIPPNYRRC